MTSQITISPNGGATFAGKEAVALFRAIALKSGMRLYLKTKIKPNRMWTPKVMLGMATSITNKSYKRGPKGFIAAIADVEAWIEATKQTIPVEVRL